MYSRVGVDGSDKFPLDDSEAFRFNGIVNNITEKSAIPLVCQEACKHFVTQALKKSK